VNILAGVIIGWIASTWKILGIMAVSWGIIETLWLYGELQFAKRVNNRDESSRALLTGLPPITFVFAFGESAAIGLVISSIVFVVKQWI